MMDASLIDRILEEQIRGINVRISELESAKTSNGGEEARIDELKLAKMRLQQQRTRQSEIFENGGCNPPDRIMKLQFRNELPKSVRTGEEFSVDLAVIDPTTNNIVETGPESSAKVEIVALDGGVEDDLTGEAFKEKIVPEMEGRKPFLKGNVHVNLQKGKGSLNKISFKHNRNNTKQRQFRLWARITNRFFDGVRVTEAMTETFTVKDYRGQYYEKHENPLLSDEVSRLKNIGRYGRINKDLKHNQIETVEDFLIQHLRNPERLKEIVNLREKKKWEDIVKNARACQDDGKMYCYVNREQKMGVVFNVLGEVLGLYSNNQYAATAVLCENHQDLACELLSSARTHWEDVRPFYDKNALEEYLIGKSSSRSKRWKKFLNVFKVISFGGSKRHYAPSFDDEELRLENVNIDEDFLTELMEYPETQRHISEIQPDDRVISSPNHLENFWDDPYDLPHEYDW